MVPSLKYFATRAVARTMARYFPAPDDVRDSVNIYCHPALKLRHLYAYGPIDDVCTVVRDAALIMPKVDDQPHGAIWSCDVPYTQETEDAPIIKSEPSDDLHIEFYYLPVHLCANMTDRNLFSGVCGRPIIIYVDDCVTIFYAEPPVGS